MVGSKQAKIATQLGRTAVVTGATGGLGYEAALALAKAGSEVILTGRDDRKGRSAIEKISREMTGAKLSYEHLDLTSLASIDDFAQRMQARHYCSVIPRPTAPDRSCSWRRARRQGRAPITDPEELASCEGRRLPS